MALSLCRTTVDDSARELMEQYVAGNSSDEEAARELEFLKSR